MKWSSYITGKGAGSLIGGYLMKFFGTRPTYQIFATATFITGCIYYLFNKFYLHKRAASDENDLCKKKPKELDVECRETTTKEVDKVPVVLDSAKIESNKDVLTIDKTKNGDVKQQAKLVPENTDGGSDSGVDNPAYNETEISPISKKDNSKPSGL